VRVTVRGIVAVVAIALVAAAIGVGAYLVGPPAEERARRLDDQRLADLVAIRAQAQSFFRQTRRLPGSLQEMSSLPNSATHDPVTNRPYGYRVTGEETFELCAEFDRPSDPDRLTDSAFSHGAGHACFPGTVRTAR